jgi:hypothetical protein
MEIIGGAIGLLAVLMIFGFVVAVNVFWIWMLVLAIQNKGLSDGEKVGWVLAIVFFHIIGSILYLCIGHPKRNTPLLGVRTI